MTLQAAALIAQVLAALAAVLLARRHAPHHPAAVALVLLAATNLLEVPILAGLTPYRVEPWEGWGRVFVYIDGALRLSYPAILAGLPVALAFSERRRRRVFAIVAGVWIVASVVLAVLYPSPVVRGAGLQQIYIAADFFALALASLALLTEARADIAAGRRPNSSSLVASALVILDGGILVVPFSPWRNDVFISPYFGPQLVLLAMFTLIAAVEAIAWKLLSPRG